MSIREFILKDVRCFAGEQRVRVAPLTFLVGENSTGKTTTLGCLNAILNESNMRFSNFNFNQTPYQLGAFAEIARKGKKSFDLGYICAPSKANKAVKVYFTFSNVENDTVVKQSRYIFSEGELIINRGNKTSQEVGQPWVPFKVAKEGGKFTVESNKNVAGAMSLDSVLSNMYLSRSQAESDDDNKTTVDELKQFFQKNINVRVEGNKSNRMFGYSFPYPNAMGRGVVSIPPIRSKPQRTYDPIAMILDEGGDDVAKYLMRIKLKGDRQKIFESLQKFGEASGLFEAIDVKLYGESTSEPFQIQVKVRNMLSNLLDVGYGISQVLPILVRVFADERFSAMLIQQPEVHLHPRAQAELSSLFVASIRERHQSFIIETHSDYMIDRARIEIRRGNIKPEDVSLVYFEPTGKNNSVDIYNISYDELGNLQNVPQGYRDFFMREGDRLLGFDD